MLFNRLLRHATEHGLCSTQEYAAILAEIQARSAPNVLIFGVGADSLLWLAANTEGRTHFLEDDPEWYDQFKFLPSLHKVEYDTEDWDNQVLYPPWELDMILPDPVEHIHWDLIFVDAPVGAVQGRMKSIHNAARLMRQSASAAPVVFVHDYDRPSERLYVDRYFEHARRVVIDRLVKLQL